MKIGQYVNYEINDVIITNSGNTYEVLECLGYGGNGVVHNCIGLDGNEYAVKFLLKTSKKNKMRFQQEINLLKKISHPNVIHFYDEGEVEGASKDETISIPFFVMEKAETNLVDYIKANESIRYEHYASQFRGLFEGLAKIHEYALHRDIKPENILIKGDRWIISDFGLCEFINDEHKDITRVYEKVGPAMWISPEAINDFYFGMDSIKPYSDVYQIIMVIIFSVTKRFPGGIINEPISELTPEISNLFLKSISNNPNERPIDGKDLLDKYNMITIGS